MEKAKEFLNNWINDVSNDQAVGEHMEYSEREVVEMLHDYKAKDENLPISHVSKCAVNTHRGHEIEQKEKDVWVYSDNGLEVRKYHGDRPCGFCEKNNSKEGHDGCIGELPGLMNACCGHGKENEAYVQFHDGRSIHGGDAVAIQDVLKKHVC